MTLVRSTSVIFDLHFNFIDTYFSTSLKNSLISISMINPKILYNYFNVKKEGIIWSVLETLRE